MQIYFKIYKFRILLLQLNYHIFIFTELEEMKNITWDICLGIFWCLYVIPQISTALMHFVQLNPLFLVTCFIYHWRSIGKPPHKDLFGWSATAIALFGKSLRRTRPRAANVCSCLFFYPLTKKANIEPHRIYRRQAKNKNKSSCKMHNLRKNEKKNDNGSAPDERPAEGTAINRVTLN